MNANSDALAISSLPPPPAPPAGLHRAAFFGLDKTLIPGSSLFLAAQGLQERDFYRRAEMLRFAWQQFAFRTLRSGGLETLKAAALDFVEGRHRPDVEALAREIAAERIVPLVFPVMTSLIEQHRTEGLLTYVTTAAPAELAEVVAARLGMTGALGTRAEVDEAERYSGRLAGSVLHGPAKATAVQAHAAAAGIDLAASVAYSDSFHDLPLLELVGHAEVVNPDRRLRQVADERGWPVHELRAGKPRRQAPAPVVTPVLSRLAALALQSPVRHEGPAGTRSRNHIFTTDDPDSLVRELEASGRFRRDTRIGGVFHHGHVSLREVSPTHSLHITLGEGNRVTAHVDRYSPLATTQPDVGARYSLPRIAVHNVAGIAGDLARLLPRRRRRLPACCAEGDDAGSPSPASGSAA